MSKNTKAPRAGSSPLTRGKHDLRDRLSPEDRLIPAHAGKTVNTVKPTNSVPAHPRSRGENIVAPYWVGTMRGSSPLTRGKRRIGRHEACRARLIPAHAGKTHGSAALRPSRAAHPRSRGENPSRTGQLVGGWGSSPLTRGKLGTAAAAKRLGRLIPAHAGKTETLSSGTTSLAAHPRSRGENGCGSPDVPRCTGSSPLTRGKPVAASWLGKVAGLIPAHAGKTLAPTPEAPARPAHPRSRGENRRTSCWRLTTRGSSPLTRGKLRGRRVARCRARLIPAHAGKTKASFASVTSLPAHPRSRGENCRESWSRSSRKGSSPLTRGKRESNPPSPACVGLIPAHAGKTYGLQVRA